MYVKPVVKRHKAKIVYEILVCCNGTPVIASHICRHANLNHGIFKKVVRVLVECGFLSGSKNKGYVTSQSGWEFIRRYHELETSAKPLAPFFGEDLF